jgi:hypothetical protein
MTNYCEHFAAMASPKLVHSNKFACLVCKTPTPLVWICLTVISHLIQKGCGTMVCENNKSKHMIDHH